MLGGEAKPKTTVRREDLMVGQEVWKNKGNEQVAESELEGQQV